MTELLQGYLGGWAFGVKDDRLTSHMNDRSVNLGVMGLTLATFIMSGSALYNYFAVDDYSMLRGQVAVSGNAAIYNYSPEEAAQGVTIHAGAHNFFSCNAASTTAITIQNSQHAIRWWAYEFTGNEPPFNGRYYFSSSLLTDNPSLSSSYNLTELVSNKRYYVITEKDLTFRCNEGLSVNAFCGDGEVSPDEECDSGDRDEIGCTKDCTIRTGYTCDGEPSECTRLIPNLPGGDSSSSSSSSLSMTTESFPSSSSSPSTPSSSSSSTSSPSSASAISESVSSSSSSVYSKTYPWTLDATDDAAETQYHNLNNPTRWGRCDRVGIDHCIRYVSYKVSGNSFSLRVRVDLDPHDIDAQKYDFVSSTLWKRDPDGTWTKVTSIKPDQYWGNSPYSVFERSLTSAPGTHVYKVMLHKGRVNAYGISVGQSETIEEIAFSVVIEEPDPDVTIEGLQTEHFNPGGNYERVQFTGTVTGYSKGDHVGCINWGRGLEKFRIADDGTFDVHVSKRVQSGIPGNPGNELFLRTYCPGFPVKLIILGDTHTIRTRCALTNATIYDREDVCPFNE
jgi:cysteine-rich repeat protein